MLFRSCLLKTTNELSLRKSPLLFFKVVLVDADKYHFAKDEVHEFIHYNYNDHTNDPSHARSIVAQVTNLDLHIDGCLTFWEDCGPLTANICKLLGLAGKCCKAVNEIISFMHLIFNWPLDPL